MAKTHKSVTEILSNSSQLRGIIAKAKQLEILNDTLVSLLPDNLKRQCYITNLEKNQLVIATESAVWATTLRYEIPNLLEGLRKNSPEIANIKVILLKK